MTSATRSTRKQKAAPSEKDVLVAFLRKAKQVSGHHLPAYRSKFSRRRFTQHQIMACAMLGEFLNIDLRSLETLLVSDPRFAKAIGLAEVPDHSTLSRHLSRVPKDSLAKMLSETVAAMPSVRQAATQKSATPSRTGMRNVLRGGRAWPWLLMNQALVSLWKPRVIEPAVA